MANSLPSWTQELYGPLTRPALEHVPYRSTQSRSSPSIDLFQPDSISYLSLSFPNIITLATRQWLSSRHGSTRVISAIPSMTASSSNRNAAQTLRRSVVLFLTNT